MKIVPIRIKKVGPDGEPLDASFRILQYNEEKGIVEVKEENGGIETIETSNIKIDYQYYSQGEGEMTLKKYRLTLTIYS